MSKRRSHIYVEASIAVNINEYFKTLATMQLFYGAVVFINT